MLLTINQLEQHKNFVSYFADKKLPFLFAINILMHIFTRTAHHSLEKRETHKSCLKINKLHEWQKRNFSFVVEQFEKKKKWDTHSMYFTSTYFLRASALPRLRSFPFFSGIKSSSILFCNRRCCNRWHLYIKRIPLMFFVDKFFVFSSSKKIHYD